MRFCGPIWGRTAPKACARPFGARWTKDLDVLPVNWKGCREPADTAGEATLQTGVEYLTPYRVHRELERNLAGMRTDLDSFTEVEAYCLMASGYQMTREYAPDLGTEAAGDNRFERRWRGEAGRRERAASDRLESKERVER